MLGKLGGGGRQSSLLAACCPRSSPLLPQRTDERARRSGGAERGLGHVHSRLAGVGVGVGENSRRALEMEAESPASKGVSSAGQVYSSRLKSIATELPRQRTARPSGSGQVEVDGMRTEASRKEGMTGAAEGEAEGRSTAGRNIRQPGGAAKAPGPLSMLWRRMGGREAGSRSHRSGSRETCLDDNEGVSSEHGWCRGRRAGDPSRVEAATSREGRVGRVAG